MRSVKILGIVAATLVLLAPAVHAFFFDFEDGKGKNGRPIGNAYCIEFVNSQSRDWLYGDSGSGSYNTHSVDLGLEWNEGNYNHYGYVWTWLGLSGDWGRINFVNQDGTFFQICYCSGTVLTLEAYDSMDNLLDSDSGNPNRRYREGATDVGRLKVRAPRGEYIAWVKIKDSGGYWLIDNIQGDSVVPTAAEPKTWGSLKMMYKD